jgi:UDP-2,3-diacylglucosamine pyrophosphatase LpxH
MAHYKSIFISDLHLGTKHSRVKKCIEFLKNNECDNLFLVGDIIDGWSLRRKWFWDSDHNLMIQKILRKSRKGTRVVYLPGNHDEFLRDFRLLQNFGGIEIVDEILHTTANGKKYLIIHGDKFDGALNSFRILSHIGSYLYDVLLDINTIYNRIRHKFGFGYWSLSHFLKSNTKKAVQFCSKFETLLVDAAKRHGADGVICGHIHTPFQKMIDDIEYHNTGCWVEMATAIVEHEDGRLELLNLD